MNFLGLVVFQSEISNLCVNFLKLIKTLNLRNSLFRNYHGGTIVLMQQVNDPEARQWHAENTLKNGIARSVLFFLNTQNTVIHHSVF